MATHESSSSSQQKKRRGLWIALGLIGGALILILIGVVTVLVVSNHPATKPPPSTDKTPQEALTTYASDLKQGNYHDAYNHLSTDYKHIFNTNPKTEAAYTAAESAVINPRGGIKTFTSGDLFLVDVGNGNSSSGAKGYLDYTFANGSTTRVFFLLTLEGSHWKILSETYQLR
jgi:hypothetical protein